MQSPISFASMFHDEKPMRKLLPLLLKDWTTEMNIVWATETYARFGAFYHADRQMFPDFDINLIMDGHLLPRVQKTKEEQQVRTKKKAEVFTPSWLCNIMNNFADDDWFGRKDVFNIEKEQTWETTKMPIQFQKRFGWQKYVLSPRLEITCGEAPYLVSRYDTVTGDPIPIADRIGILDRKLRIVNENAKSDKNWCDWVTKAFQSVYGYEYQGDNLFFARVNLVQTFIDYYEARFHKFPSMQRLRRIAEIVSKNIWQMDGLKGTVPFQPQEGFPDAVSKSDEQENAFGFLEMEDINELPLCKVWDWQKHEVVLFRDIKAD